jgi:hypothetical protein
VGDFFYSAEAKELVSRALGASSAEVDSLYCPRALEPVAQSDADAAFGRSDACADCPRCGTTLRAVRDGTWHYACASCAWTSRAVDLEDGEDDLHLAMKLAQREAEAPRAAAFAAALARLRASGFGGAGAEGASRDDDAEARALRDPLPEPLEARLRQPLAPDARQRLAPTRPKLASLVTCRRVADVEAGRAGILRKPRPHPLDGDSSAGGAGGRHRKDASAHRTVGGRRPPPPPRSPGRRERRRRGRRTQVPTLAFARAPRWRRDGAAVAYEVVLFVRNPSPDDAMTVTIRPRPLPGRRHLVADFRATRWREASRASTAAVEVALAPRDEFAVDLEPDARALRALVDGAPSGFEGVLAATGARATVRLLCRADGAVAAGGDWHAAAARTCAAPIDRVALGLAVSCRVASFGAAVVLPWPGGLASEAWEVARGCACLF